METCDECKEKTYVIILDQEYKKECPKCREKSHPITIKKGELKP